MVRRKKTVKAGEKMKKVTFADPIATELKAPKPTILDDSIILIKEKETDKMTAQRKVAEENNWATGGNNMNHVVTVPAEKEAALMIEKEGMQQALTETLKIMQKQLAMPTVIPHFARPINKDKMDAITTLIEQRCKKQKKASSNRKMQVGLDASTGVQPQ